MFKKLDEIKIAINGCGSGDEEKGFYCGETHLCQGCLNDVNKLLEHYPEIEEKEKAVACIAGAISKQVDQTTAALYMYKALKDKGLMVVSIQLAGG